MSFTISDLTYLTIGAVAEQLAAVLRVSVSIPARSNVCDPQIVVPNLGVIYMWNCVFVNAPTTREKVWKWGKVLKKNLINLLYTYLSTFT